MTVLERGEVELYGVRYPILGPVQPVPVNPFPGKVTVGDYTRDDELVASSWVQSSWSGGMGIENGVYPRDQDRSWYTTLETRWQRALALGPAIGSAPLAAAAAGRGRAVVYKGAAIVAVGPELARMTVSGLTPIRTWATEITDLVVSGDALWIALDGADCEAWDGTTFTPAVGEQPVALADLGGWLYGLTVAGALRARSPLTGEWVDAGRLERPPGWAEQLITYQAPNGDFTLYAVGADGLYVWDATTQRFFLSTVTWPVGLPVGRATVWRGDLYVPVGPSIYRYNGQVVAPVGPDKDEGLPPELPDQVAAVYGSHSQLIALLVGRSLVASVTGRDVARDSDGLRVGTRLGGGVFGVAERATRQLPGALDPELVAETLVLGTTGASWHVLAPSPTWRTVGVGVVVVGGEPRMLWHEDGTTLRWVALPATIVNPLRPQLAATRARGTLVTPWFDANWAEISKQALRLKVRAEAASPDLPIRVSQQLSADAATWEPIGEVTAPGETTFRLGTGERGVTFRRIRLRLDLERRAGAPEATPIVSSTALSFLRRPEMRFAYSFTIDLSRPWRGRSVTELRDALLEAATSPDVGSFAFADDPAGTHVVSLSRLQLLLTGGRDGFEGSQAADGRAAVSVIEV